MKLQLSVKQLRNRLVGAKVLAVEVEEGDECFVVSRLVFSGGIVLRFVGDYDEGGMCFAEGK